jgi:hypothetical protein
MHYTSKEPPAGTNELILNMLVSYCFRFDGASRPMKIMTKDNDFMSMAWLTVIPAKILTSIADKWLLRPELVEKQARGGQ